MSQQKRSPFDILGVSQYSSQKEIKRAYLALCKKYHPDVALASSSPHTTSVIDFREITGAYELLNNSKKNNRILHETSGVDWEAVKQKNINTKVWTRNSYLIGFGVAALTLLYLTMPDTTARRFLVLPRQQQEEEEDEIIINRKETPWQASNGQSFREWRKRGGC